MRKETVYRIFSKIPALETDRLILRKLVPSDYEDMYEYSRLSDVTRYLTWKPHPDVFYTRSYLDYLETRYASGLFYDWGLEDKATGKMIGTCGFTSFNYHSDSAEIGYVLHPDFWGRGLATEACEKVMEFGFDRLLLHRLEAHFMEGNTQSLRVMQKLGMKLEGYHRESMLVKGTYVTVGVCSILVDEYLVRMRNR